jgi:hypothetical protein
MSEGKTVELTVNIRYKKGYTGMLVGQCRQLPFIIVEGKDVDELTKKVAHDMTVFFKTFPEEGKRILEEHGKIIETEGEKQKMTKVVELELTGEPQETTKDTEQGWAGTKIQVPIPISR